MSVNDLLNLAVHAHGGRARWTAVREIHAVVTISGGLLDIKGFPGQMRDTAVTTWAHEPRTILDPCAGPSTRGVFTPQRVWLEDHAGDVQQERTDPRSSFAGHVRQTPWDELHRLYFFGYALWNYLNTPFLFEQPGFQLEELAPHTEDDETWRVLRVTFPPDIPAHCAVQLYYFDNQGILKRVDYETDIAGGVASHYCYDPKSFDGLVFYQRRRVVQRTATGPRRSGPTAVFLDFTSVTLT